MPVAESLKLDFLTSAGGPNPATAEADRPIECIYCSPARRMKLSQIAAQIEALDPEASPLETARLASLMIATLDDLELLANPDVLDDLRCEICLRLLAAADQHAAVTSELRALVASDPAQFDREEIAILFRAIRIQSQILDLYLGHDDEAFL